MPLCEARLISLVHQSHHLVVVLDDELAEVLDIGAEAWVFSDFEIPLVLRVQEVANPVVRQSCGAY